MVLVTLGTQDKPFTRLLQAVEKQIKFGNINDEVIVQAGCTKYNSNMMKILEYIQIEDFEKIYDEADLIITHAGVGNIITGLERNKKMIVAARLKKYGEHINDHQLQILENFTQNGYILPLNEFDELDQILKEIKSFIPNKFKSNNEIFLQNIKNEINMLI